MPVTEAVYRVGTTDTRINIRRQKYYALQKRFAEHILKGISKDMGTDPVNKLWEVDRMKELRAMLDFEKKPVDEKTRYMSIKPKNEFKERRVLPCPTEVHTLGQGAT